MRTAASLALLAGCFTSSVEPPRERAAAKAKPRACTGTFELEARGWRGHPNMDASVTMDVIEEDRDDDLWVDPLAGPYRTLADACAECAQLVPHAGMALFEEVATGQGKLAVRVAGAWWSRDLGSIMAAQCKLVVDRPWFVDMNRSGRGPELILRTEELCMSVSHPEPADAEGNEYVMVCGVGRSNAPGCSPVHLGVNAFEAERSRHGRWRFGCDGDVDIAYWELPDYQSVTRYQRRARLQFP